jgi:hypothetical protein
MTDALRRAAKPFLLLGLLGLCPGSLRAQTTLSQTFFGAFGGVSMSSGPAVLATSGTQAAGAVMSAGLTIIEDGFLRFFATQNAGTTGNPAYSISYVLAGGEVTLSLPAGACPSNTSVTLQAPASVPANSGAIQVVPGTVVQVLACPSPTAAVTLAFTGLNMTGLDQQQLAVGVYNTTTGVWIPLNSQLNSVSGVLTASVNHLTTFAAVESSPSSSSGSVLVYPNPFLASRGDTGVNFINLPAGTGLRVYTLRGEEVKDLTANAAGQAFWDTTNRSGVGVATGVYFVVLQGGGKNETIKVGVHR